MVIPLVNRIILTPPPPLLIFLLTWAFDTNVAAGWNHGDHASQTPHFTGELLRLEVNTERTPTLCPCWLKVRGVHSYRFGVCLPLSSLYQFLFLYVF